LGPGNLDLWIKAGRPGEWLSSSGASYVSRVLDQSETRDGAAYRARARPATLLGGCGDAAAAASGNREEAVADPRLRKQSATTIASSHGCACSSLRRTRQNRAWRGMTSRHRLAEIDRHHPEKLANADPAGRAVVPPGRGEVGLCRRSGGVETPRLRYFKMGKAPRAEPDMAASRLIASVLLVKARGGKCHPRPGRRA